MLKEINIEEIFVWKRYLHIVHMTVVTCEFHDNFTIAIVALLQKLKTFSRNKISIWSTN